MFPDRPWGCSGCGLRNAGVPWRVGQAGGLPRPAPVEHGGRQQPQRPDGVSSRIVSGPSLTLRTAMVAPNSPVATGNPRACNSAQNALTSGSAWPAGAAACQLGLRPELVSAYSVNWLMTSTG